MHDRSLVGAATNQIYGNGDDHTRGQGQHGLYGVFPQDAERVLTSHRTRRLVPSRRRWDLRRFHHMPPSYGLRRSMSTHPWSQRRKPWPRLAQRRGHIGKT